MNQSKDLNWLGAPAFFLILGMIFFSVKKSGFEKSSGRIRESKSITLSQK